MTNTRAPSGGGTVTSVRLDDNVMTDLRYLQEYLGGLTVSGVVRLLIADAARAARRGEFSRLAS